MGREHVCVPEASKPDRGHKNTCHTAGICQKTHPSQNQSAGQGLGAPSPDPGARARKAIVTPRSPDLQTAHGVAAQPSSPAPPPGTGPCRADAPRPAAHSLARGALVPACLLPCRGSEATCGSGREDEHPKREAPATCFVRRAGHRTLGQQKTLLSWQGVSPVLRKSRGPSGPQCTPRVSDSQEDG